MLAIVFGISAGYVLGMAFIGYAYALATLRAQAKILAIKKPVVIAATLIHFLLGILGGVIFPAVGWRSLRDTMPEGFGIAFGLSCLLSLALAFLCLSRDPSECKKPDQV